MADEINTELDGSGPDEVVIKQARDMGWTPQDKFKGDPEKWVDADEFVRRGEQLMPLLRKTNQRLKEDLAARDAEIDNLRSKTENMQATLDRLDAHYSAANKRAAEQAITGLKDQLKSAREDGDVDKEVELLQQIGLAQSEVQRLTDEDAKKKEKEKDKPPVEDKATPKIDPSLKAWQRENDWFGTDPKKTRQFNRIAEDLREDLNESGEDDKYSPVEFLERCSELWEEQFGEAKLPSKTDGGNRSGGSQSPGSVKGWNQLPKEAKEACLADVDVLVGEGKRFPTLEDWKKEYVRIYNAT